MFFDEQPQYTHIGRHAVFLGHFRNADLYVHLGRFPEFVARSSSEASDERWGITEAYGADPLLTEARRRAEQRDLVQPNVREALRSITPASSEDVLFELKALLRANPYSKILQHASIGQLGAVAELTAMAEVYRREDLLLFPDLPRQRSILDYAGMLMRLNDWLKFFEMPHLTPDYLQEVLSRCCKRD